MAKYQQNTSTRAELSQQEGEGSPARAGDHAHTCECIYIREEREQTAFREKI